jgi:hypothetical protein
LDPMVWPKTSIGSIGWLPFLVSTLAMTT